WPSGIIVGRITRAFVELFVTLRTTISVIWLLYLRIGSSGPRWIALVPFLSFLITCVLKLQVLREEFGFFGIQITSLLVLNLWENISFMHLWWTVEGLFTPLLFLGYPWSKDVLNSRLSLRLRGLEGVVAFTVTMDFLLLINRLGLVDMGYVGADFTWKRGTNMAVFISKRLDRVLTNLEGKSF
ncbi:hypothetical protein V2J09_020425, partial [Rumex salicifolius]